MAKYDSKSLASVSTSDSLVSIEPSMGYVFPKTSSRRSGVKDHIVTVEVPLTDEMVGILCRRGRRRLHELKEACQASLHVDKVRRILKVSSSEDGVAAVQEQLLALEGPRREIPRAVWAELMRTRTQESGPEAALAQLQQASGCRIHIERHEPKVRLFGPRTCVADAQSLLHEFEEKVVESHLLVGDDMPSTAALESLAHSCGITVRAEDQQVALLGLRGAVEQATQELTEHVTNLRGGMGSAVPVVQAVSTKAPLTDPLPSPSATFQSASGKVLPSGSLQVGVPQLSDSKPRFPQRTECPTCGACAYCSGCGALTSAWFMAAPMPQQPPIAADVAMHSNAGAHGAHYHVQYLQPMMNPFQHSMPGSPQASDGGIVWMAPMDQGAAFPTAFVPMVNAMPFTAPSTGMM